MSRQVLIENNDNKVIAPATEVNKVVVLDNCEPNSVKVYDTANNVIKVITQGPQGATGEIPDISGYLTTASFNALTSSMSVLNAETSSFSNYSISSSYSNASTSASYSNYANSAFSSVISNIAQSSNYASFAGVAITSSHALNSNHAISSSFAESGNGSFSGSFSGSGQNLSNIPASAIIGLNLSQISSGSVSASISPNEGMVVNTSVTASAFTGSFYGDGQNLKDIPASAIIGLNLSQISSGSYSASISENGLLVNTKIIADSFTGSLEGTSSFSNYAESSSYAITSSYAVTASYAANVPDTASYALSALSSSYAETASYAPNYLSLEGGLVSGSITLLGDLTVYGSSSLVYVTASQLAISASTISLNVFEPAERFAGIIVYDSGSLSHMATASLFWDSQTNHWVYQNASGSTYSGGALISGPRNTGSLGQETYPTRNRIVRGQGGDHIYDSNILDDNSKVGIQISTDITGSLYVSNGISGSLFGTSSWSNNSVSSSYSYTASSAISSSHALTASYIQASGVVGLNLSQISTGSATASISPDTGLVVNTAVTASAFTGSFYGDGSNLNSIPATAIVGLNLSQIASGSATASISPNGGLQVNTSLSVSGNLNSLQTASLPNIKDSYSSSGLSGSILAMTSQGTKWTTVKDSLMIQIISEGPTINSGSKGFKFVSEQNYIEKVSIRSFFTGSVQFILKDSNVTYGSASLSNDVYFEDTSLTSWIRTIPSQTLLEFLVSPPSGSVNGPIANFVFIINTVRSIT